MNMKVFFLNESKRLKTSSQKIFFESSQNDKSYYWIDVEDPAPASLKEFPERLGLHPSFWRNASNWPEPHPNNYNRFY